MVEIEKQMNEAAEEITNLLAEVTAPDDLVFRERVRAAKEKLDSLVALFNSAKKGEA